MTTTTNDTMTPATPAPVRHTKASIARLLATNDKAIYRGILAIYARQTQDEQSSATTSHDNGMGFTGADARLLSRFAEQIAFWENTPERERKYPTPLSAKQLTVARERMGKYAGQLAKIANEKAQAQAAAAQSTDTEAVTPAQAVIPIDHPLAEDASGDHLRVYAERRAASMAAIGMAAKMRMRRRELGLVVIG